MDCSATGPERLYQHAAGSMHAQVLPAVVLLLSFSFSASAQSSAELEDAAARAQYAFFTGDTRALEDVLSTLEDSDFQARLAPLKAYHLAYAQWKLAQLYSEQAKNRSRDFAAAATKVAKRCVEQAKAAIKLDPGMAEAYALQAVCKDKPQSFMRLAGLNVGSCERSRSLRSAQALAPQNPRIVLVAAVCARASEQDDEIARWRRVADAFQAAPARVGAPDWGQAEALTLLGEALLERGQKIPARDAIEQALVIAPDYEAARSLLQAASHSR